MINHVERNLEHEKAVLISEKYREFNKKTKVKLSTYDPRLRIWRFDIVERDPKAVEMKPYIKSETHNRKENKKPAKPEPQKSPILKKKRELHDESLRGEIYQLYKDGIDRKTIAKKFNISGRRVATEIWNRNTQLGIKQTLRKNTNRLNVENLYKTEKSASVIAKQLGIARSTVRSHIEKINSEGNKKSKSI